MASRILFSCCVVLLTGAVASHAERVKPAEGALGMKFVPVPKGTFYMGWNGAKGSARKTDIKDDFEIGIYPVTQGQWRELMGKNPSHFSRKGAGKKKVEDVKDEDLERFPVERVSWHDSQLFLEALNKKEKGKGWWYRLPSEAEWEYAGRGAATSEEECSYHFYFEKPTNDLSSKQANFNGSYPFGKAEKGPFLGRTTKVGSYAPNKLGLYDVHGNVHQWCSDRHGEGGLSRVYRGSAWANVGVSCQVASRFGTAEADRTNTFGLRLVRVPARQQPK